MSELLGARQYALAAKKAALAPALPILEEILRELEERCLREVMKHMADQEKCQLALLEIRCYRQVMQKVRQRMDEELREP